MNQENPVTYTLPCGLRVVCLPGTSDVVYCGLAIDAGTRDELPDEHGLAHYTEHLSFKGTGRRNAWHIANRMESVGGELNAFTGKEETVYYCACMKEHLPRAVDVLMDMVFHSTYPGREMEKEVEVVANEIESYNDSPGELIYDEFEDMQFHGHPLGRSILGDAAHLRRMGTDDIMRFTRRLYTPRRTVLFVYGNVSPTRVKALAAKHAPAAAATLECLVVHFIDSSLQISDQIIVNCFQRFFRHILNCKIQRFCRIRNLTITQIKQIIAVRT